MANIVEVNGVKYSQNEQPKKRGTTSKMGSMLTMMMAMSGGMDMGMNMGGYSRTRPSVDIVKEYELIEQKKSHLSKSDRCWVVNTFKSNYTKFD